MLWNGLAEIGHDHGANPSPFANSEHGWKNGLVPLMSVITQISSMLWRRVDKPGSDAARLHKIADGYELSGKYAFLAETGPAALSYCVKLSPQWVTLTARINGFVGKRQVDDQIERGHGGWKLNNRDLGMADIQDVDLAFTPATNLAQLMRAGLDIGESTAFDVAWLDAESGALERLPQEYRRLSEHAFDYRSPTFDYRATIVLASNGFVSDYPELWKSVDQ